MRVVLVSILIALVTSCASQYYVSSKEQYRELPDEFDIDNHEYYRIYTPHGLYPKHLCDSGFEGYAVVEFDIDTAGNTMNHRVVESDAQQQFEEVAISNAVGIKYLPRTIRGQALEVTGVRVRTKFCVGTCRDPDNNCKHVSEACN